MSRRLVLLLTRPEAQSRAFAAALETAWPWRFDPLVAPMLRIALEPGPVDLQGAGALAFTSVNGVAAFAGLCPDRSLPAYCVGDMTARAARDAGFRALSAGGDVAALAQMIATAGGRPPGDVLHVRGRQAAGDLTGALAGMGIPARPLELYAQIRSPLAGPARDLAACGGIDVLTAFSPRSAAALAEQARSEGWPLGGCTLVALSAAASVAHRAPEPGRRIIARAPTREGMIAALGLV